MTLAGNGVELDLQVKPVGWQGSTKGVPLPFFKMRVLTAILGIGCILAFLIGMNLSQPQVIVRTVYQPVSTSEFFEAKIWVPAVDAEGNGIISQIEVRALPGTGRILTNIDKILFWIDTQQSIRTARKVAEELTGFDLSEWDLIYTVKANATAVEGPSAGAALVLVTLAALENKTLNSNVTITGTIDEDGKLGQAGGVLAKAEAAAAAGAKLLLVPKGTRPEGWKRKLECRETDGLEECRLDYVKGDLEELGIEIKEIEDIREALPYFGL